MRKSIKEYHITELSNLAYIIDTLPLEIDNTLNIDGEEIDIDEYIERRTEQFFSVPDKNFEDIVGKAFINKEQNVIFKVVGYNPHSPGEFYYEQYSRTRTGWEPKDSIWLDEESVDFLRPYYTGEGELEALETWGKDPAVDMNIGREEMYMLGIDGNMYVDTSCGGDYDVYYQMNDGGATFELIKQNVK